MPIIDVDEKAVHDLSSQGNNVILKYYAPWCDHCKRFAPVFQQIVNSYDAIPHVVAGQVDCVKEKSYCRESLIIGYPSVRLVTSDGKMRYFQGRNTPEKIVGFISFFLNTSVPIAPPVELVNYIAPSAVADALKSSSQTLLILVWRPTEDATRAMEIARHIAWIFLVTPSVRVCQTPLDDALPSGVRAALGDSFPQFVIIDRGRAVPCDISAVEEDMQEEALLELVNDYAGTTLSINGNHVLPPGRVESIEKLLRTVKRFDAAEIKRLRHAVRKLTDVSESIRDMYLSSLQVLRDNGMNAIWNLLEEKRKALRELEDLDEDVEDLVIERNILRSLARDIEEDVEEEQEL